MKRFYYYILYIAILILSGLATTATAQSITIGPYSVGFVSINDKICGTGFVFKKANIIVTCAHVIYQDSAITYTPVAGNRSFKVKLKYKLLGEDLAWLEADSAISDRPFQCPETLDVLPNNHLFYLGFDKTKSVNGQISIQANNAIVLSVGKTKSFNVVASFIEFEGVGIPGYSGGPVIDDNGKVIAVMREAWFKRGLKSTDSTLINRAFSIFPLLSILK